MKAFFMHRGRDFTFDPYEDWASGGLPWDQALALAGRRGSPPRPTSSRRIWS